MDKGSISLPTVVVGQAITVGQIIKQDKKEKGRTNEGPGDSMVINGMLRIK